MHKFLPHESVANGSFNLDHNTVLPQFKVWEDELGNSEETLFLLISRLEQDFRSLNPAMRKPWASKEVATGIGEVYVLFLCSGHLSALRKYICICLDFVFTMSLQKYFHFL